MIIIITGCAEKDELTLPVRINLMCGGYFQGDIADPPGASYFQVLEINEICLGISKIEFEGERELGGNISFETAPGTNFPSIRLVPQIPQMNVTISNFDIPQGSYERFRCDLVLKEISSELLHDNSYVDTIAAGLFITGEFGQIWWNKEEPFLTDSVHIVPFEFIMDESTSLYFCSSLLNDNSDYILDDDAEYKFILFFDFSSAFESLPYYLFENAELSDNGLENKLIINKYVNREQYEVLSQMLNNSLSMYIK